MCGRYTVRSIQPVAELFGISLPPEFQPRYNVAPTQMIPVPRSDALARLMDQCLALRLRLDRDNVQKLVDWMGGIDCYALTFSSLDEAVDLVQRTAFPGLRKRAISR